MWPLEALVCSIIVPLLKSPRILECRSITQIESTKRAEINVCQKDIFGKVSPLFRANIFRCSFRRVCPAFNGKEIPRRHSSPSSPSSSKVIYGRQLSYQNRKKHFLQNSLPTLFLHLPLKFYTLSSKYLFFWNKLFLLIS